jgi:hypothetical protein
VGKRSTAVLLALFVLVSAGAVLFWRQADMHAITGDEPHYLVMADGLLPTFELEQTGPYTREFRNRTIVKNGLVPVDEVPSPSNTHAEEGPRGLFNVHNLGLPVILAVPYLLGGELAARLAMVLIGALIVFALTRVVSLAALTDRDRIWVLLPIAVGLPFVTGATQLYPDLPAGAICLAAVWMLLRGPDADRPRDGLFTTSMLAFLPWLHIRFALPMAIMIAALAWVWRGRRSLVHFIIRFGSPALVSVALLATYNWYAFGNMTGPYQSGDVMLNRIAVMQFLGLFFDQNQGIALQQPLYFVALLYVGRLVRRHPVPVIASVSAAIAMVGPNATHWNLYGGWSFSGRFGWGAAAVLAPIVVLSVADLRSEHRKTGAMILTIACLVQLRHLVAVFLQKRVLLPHTFDGWIGTYSTFWGPIEQYLPQWRDYRWAYSYAPNLVILAVAVGMILVGSARTLSGRGRVVAVSSVVGPAVVVLAMFGRFGDLPFPQQRWAASVLPGATGAVENLSRLAMQGDERGLLTFGPFWEVPRGDYEIGIRYASTDNTVGNAILDVYFPTTDQVVNTVRLPATGPEAREMFMRLSVTKKMAGRIEIRTFYEGVGALRVDWIQLRRVSENTDE